MDTTYETDATVLCPDGKYATVVSSDEKITKVWKDGVYKELPTKLLMRVSDR